MCSALYLTVLWGCNLDFPRILLASVWTAGWGPRVGLGQQLGAIVTLGEADVAWSRALVMEGQMLEMFGTGS